MEETQYLFWVKQRFLRYDTKRMINNNNKKLDFIKTKNPAIRNSLLED